MKVLDFGLAKAIVSTGHSVVAAGVEAPVSPTLGVNATDAGLIFGTAAYMSPEQARGKALDRGAEPLGAWLRPLRNARGAAGVRRREPDRRDGGRSSRTSRTGADAAGRRRPRQCGTDSAVSDERPRAAARLRLEIHDALTASAAETAQCGAAPPALLARCAGNSGRRCAGHRNRRVDADGVRAAGARPVVAVRDSDASCPAPERLDSARDLACRAGASGIAPEIDHGRRSPLMLRAVGRLDARPLA